MNERHTKHFPDPCSSGAFGVGTEDEIQGGTNSSDEAQIRALEQSFSDGVKAKDVDKIMANYQPGEELVVFDLVPPREYVGWEAYKKDWQRFLDTFDGPITFEIHDLSIKTDGDMAYSYSFQHVAGKMKDGKTSDDTVRVTDVYRKTSGKWLIVHEHVSVPVDLKTGKPDLRSKP
jgi:ketosteroid isomerase-like protein